MSCRECFDHPRKAPMKIFEGPSVVWQIIRLWGFLHRKRRLPCRCSWSILSCADFWSKHTLQESTRSPAATSVRIWQWRQFASEVQVCSWLAWHYNCEPWTCWCTAVRASSLQSLLSMELQSVSTRYPHAVAPVCRSWLSSCWLTPWSYSYRERSHWNSYRLRKANCIRLYVTAGAIRTTCSLGTATCCSPCACSPYGWCWWFLSTAAQCCRVWRLQSGVSIGFGWGSP